jgi:hypothetical protein
MEHFEIQTQKTNEQTDFIVCQSKELRIKVIPPNKQPDAYGADAMVISATVGTPAVTYDFDIAPTSTGNPNPLWSMELFYEAIEYYCQHILDREPTGFAITNQANFYPYEKGDVNY